MYETVIEGKAEIRIKKTKKISKEMDVFYNPIMKLNRDISILLLDSIDKKNMNIALPLSASGIRGIRFLKELNKSKIRNISFNDYSNKAFLSIKNNLKLNKINKYSIIKSITNKSKKQLKNSIKNKIDEKIIKNNKIKIYNEDANLFLLNSKGFDYIDIDPFGTSNYYLDASIKRISRNGILAVTNTDTAALTGTYPKACIRKYWAVPKKDHRMHETGLRILIRKIQLIGMQYDKALTPIFSFFKDHYFRMFFQCVKGKKEADKITKQHGMFNYAGPLWMGNLWDNRLVNKMYSSLLKNLMKNYNIINQNNGLQKFLKMIKEESKINVVGFYDIHEIAKKRKLRIMIKKEDLIKKIKKKSYKVASTHFSGTGIRTNIPYKKLLILLKE